jgi:hypothetical protein
MIESASVVTQESSVVHARHLLAGTQLFFFLVLVVCFEINHGPTAQTNGISYYGVYRPTILLLLTGFTVAAVGLWRTAWYFAHTDAPRLTVVALRVVALGLFLLLATPYDRGTLLNWAHMTVGVTIALVQLAITVLLLATRRTARSVLGFAVQLGGGILAAASLPDWHVAFLLQGETIYYVGFGWCLIEWTYALRAWPSAT